jgi:hypothetical protein
VNRPPGTNWGNDGRGRFGLSVPAFMDATSNFKTVGGCATATTSPAASNNRTRLGGEAISIVDVTAKKSVQSRSVLLSGLHVTGL